MADLDREVAKLDSGVAEIGNNLADPVVHNFSAISKQGLVASTTHQSNGLHV